MHTSGTDDLPFYRQPMLYHLLLFCLLLIVLQNYADVLQYRRSGIESGEYWRLISGHLVHTNPHHLILNSAGLIILYLLLSPHLTPSTFYPALGFLIIGVSLGLYYLSVKTQWYAGFSGVLYGLYVVFSCIAIRRHDYFIGLSALMLILGKLALDEFGGATFSQASAKLIEAPVVTFAHLLGVGCAFIYLFIAYLTLRLKTAFST